MTQQTEISIDIAQLGAALKERGMFLCTAESCTGGLIASTLTDVAGSSEWFAGSVVAYANAVKTGLLGVSATDLETHGAVSQPVVLAMAQGVCRATGADASVAVSGIAGPGGGTPDKPVGTVWMAWCVSGHVQAQRFQFDGERFEIKLQTVHAAIQGLLQRVREP